VLAGAALYGFYAYRPNHGSSEVSSNPARACSATPRPRRKWATLTIEPAIEEASGPSTVTEGKVAVDEDKSTPVFSPYAGRVMKLIGRRATTSPRDAAVRDRSRRYVQAQNDFVAIAA